MFGEKTMESSSTTGTGAYALGTSVGAFKTWRSQLVTGSSAFYYAENADGTIWEAGYGTLTYGAPDSLSRTLIASSTGSLVSWVSADAPIYVFSVPSATSLAHYTKGGLATARPAWLPAGGGWLDFTLGLAVAWVKKCWNGTADMEEGRHYISQAIFAASQRILFVDRGAANYTFTADDIGKCLCFDTTAAVRTLTMLVNSATGVGHGAYVYVKPYGSTSNGVTFTPGGADTTDLATAPPGRMTKFQWDGAKSKWVADYVAPAAVSVPTAPAYAGVRQTVAAGPVSTAGLPTFLPSTNAALSITTQNVTSSAPLVASAANGWSATTGMPTDTVGYSSANISWTGLTASRAAATPNYLYGTISGGVITPASTILAPIYQWGGTPAVTNGQITFNIAEMKAYLGNGTTAPQTNLVVFGEAATDATTVISTVAYAYSGLYDSGFTATLPGAGTAISKSHNIGVSPERINFVAECTTSDGGYAVGARIHVQSMFNPAGGTPPSLIATALVMTVVSNSWQATNSNASSGFGMTAASWKYKFVANRSW